jgi:hypothetical protein
LQRSKAATAARHRQKRREIEPQRWHSPPFRIDGFVEPIKVSQLGDVSLDAGNIVPNGFRRLVKLLLTTARDEDVGPSSTKSLAVAKPLPVVPPVTTASFSRNLPIIVSPSSPFEMFGSCAVPGRTFRTVSVPDGSVTYSISW